MTHSRAKARMFCRGSMAAQTTGDFSGDLCLAEIVHMFKKTLQKSYEPADSVQRQIKQVRCELNR